jgi:hypothetical protein
MNSNTYPPKLRSITARWLILVALFLVSTPGFSQSSFEDFTNRFGFSTSQALLEHSLGNLLQYEPLTADMESNFSESWFVDSIWYGDYFYKASFFFNSAQTHLERIELSTLEMFLSVDEYDLRLGSLLPTIIETYGVSVQSNQSENALGRVTDEYWWLGENYHLQLHNSTFKDANIIVLSVVFNDPNAKDFRVARWGDSMSSIVMTEGEVNLTEDNNLYIFKDVVIGLNCYVVYKFVDDELVSAKYLFNADNVNNDTYIDDFRKVVDILTTKYGTADGDGRHWKDNQEKDCPISCGYSVLRGDLFYETNWNLGRTRILTKLYGTDLEIFHIVQYTSEAHQEIIDLQEKRQVYDKF